jgi:hypothetical protein
MRSVDMLIWALFFTRAFGPGPLAGSAAIFFTETGTLGKVYSEALENIDDKQREGVKSTGANGLLVQRYGVMPEVCRSSSARRSTSGNPTPAAPPSSAPSAPAASASNCGKPCAPTRTGTMSPIWSSSSLL